MLDTIKEEIAKEVPEFSEFYRNYVISVQNSAIEREVRSFGDKIIGMDSLLQAERELNQLSDHTICKLEHLNIS